ncbi:hypothetical protein ABH968_000313 [Lysinibacillus sp. RC79]
MYLMRQLGWNRGSLYSSRPLHYAGGEGFFYGQKNKRSPEELAHKQFIKEVFI